MRKPAKVSCTDPKEMRAHSRNWGLTKHTEENLFNPRHLELWAFAKPIQLLPEDESVDSAMEKH